tara:strand:+ start:1230 stop:1403 length:174 start_codon:yes stop_codon:yes gene_type:complete
MGDTRLVNFLLAVGVAAVLSGIYFIIQGDSTEGVTNFIIGLFVILLIEKQIKDNSNK